MYAGLWQRFGIPGDRAARADARFVRMLNVLALGQPEGGESEWPTT